MNNASAVTANDATVRRLLNITAGLLALTGFGLAVALGLELPFFSVPGWSFRYATPGSA